MRVLFCGVRGSTCAPGIDFVRYGGHTSCVALAHDGAAPSLVLDAGTGLRNLTRHLDGRPFRGTILRGRWRVTSHEPGGSHVEGFSVTAAEIPHKGGRTSATG